MPGRISVIGTLLVLLASPAACVEPIAGVTARATTVQVARLYDPNHLCSDVGLSDSGRGDGTRYFTTNGYTGGGCHWQSGYREHGPDEHPIVEFDLKKITTIGRIHVWNHNAIPSRGFKDVSVTVSEDGKTWRAISQSFQFAQAPKANEYLGEDYFLVPPIKARYVRFHCESTHRGGGQPDLAGLGKVRFYEASATDPKPEPLRGRRGGGRFPDAAGIINVQYPPYLARGDGRADDAPALQKAIDDWQGSSRTILLPPGIYRLSRPLRFQPGKGYGYNNICGLEPEKTILKLDDGVLTDPSKPEAVLALGFNGRPDGTGVHADWFNCNVSDLQIDTGRNNPGAIGLQFYSNNVGALRNVTLVAPDGKGAIGLDLGAADQNGPCLVKNLRIDGFAIGVRTAATVNSQTAENVSVRGASKVGWENHGQCLAIRRLSVAGTGTGFVNKFGVVALIDSTFTGMAEAAKLPAIVNGETLFARNIRTQGFQLAIENQRGKDNPTGNAPGPDVAEWISTAPQSLFPIDKPRSLNLPIQETPDVAWDAPETWADIRCFRELSDPDESAALQRAIDSGATTVYFPSGNSFIVDKPIEIRGAVRRIVGMFATVRSSKRGPVILRIADDGPPLLVLQDCRGYLQIEHQAPKRTVVVKNGQGMGGKLSRGGDLFLENVVADWEFDAGRIWARQFNTEREGTHMFNRGATVWILGLKTERGGTLIDAGPGSQTELLGGLSYTTTKGQLAPMFITRNARASFVFGEVCYTGNPFRQIVEQHRGGETRILDRKTALLRPAFLQGAQLPLFVAEP
jgi:hypothetical protein